MAETANVRSIDAIREFRSSLITFSDDARNALASVEMELRRTRNWLERDQIPYWRTQIKKRNEQLSEARADLFRRRLSQSNSDAISDSDQKEAVKKMEARLRRAEQMLEKSKSWIPLLDHAIMEYHGRSVPLSDLLGGDVMNAIATLERMTRALDAYVANAPPTTPKFATRRADKDDGAGPAETLASAARPLDGDEANAAIATNPARDEADAPAQAGSARDDSGATS